MAHQRPKVRPVTAPGVIDTGPIRAQLRELGLEVHRLLIAADRHRQQGRYDLASQCHADAMIPDGRARQLGRTYGAILIAEDREAARVAVASSVVAHAPRWLSELVGGDLVGGFIPDAQTFKNAVQGPYSAWAKNTPSGGGPADAGGLYVLVTRKVSPENRKNREERHG